MTQQDRTEQDKTGQAWLLGSTWHLIVNRGLWPADAGRGKGWPGLLGVAWLPGLGSNRESWPVAGGRWARNGLAWPTGRGLVVWPGLWLDTASNRESWLVAG